jgi:dTDP-4-amino-4,6-dideoxygalactose transaminase
MARYVDNQTTRDFVNADSVSEATFLIGCHHDLSENQIDYVAEKLKYLTKNVL